MPNFPVPEILRVSLSNICLSVRAARENEDVQVYTVFTVRYAYLHDCQGFLRRAIDPPKTSALSSSWNLLKEIGAINEDDTITALGCAIVGFLYSFLYTD